jgi:hypothetical protein
VWCENLVLQQGGFCAPGSIAISYVEQSLDMKFQDGSILCLAALCFSSDTPSRVETIMAQDSGQSFLHLMAGFSEK